MLGRNGADTITHIVSIVALLGLGAGTVGILGYFQQGQHPFDDVTVIAITGFLTVVAIMMAYYSVQYQTTPGGGVVISTVSGDGTGVTTSPVVGVSADGKTTIVIPAGYLIAN